MRLTTRRIILIILATLLWGVVFACVAVAVLSAFAWLVDSSNLGILDFGFGVVDFHVIKTRIKSIGIGFEALLLILSTTLSAILFPIAKRFWKYATSIPVDYARAIPSPEKLAFDRQQLLQTVHNNWIDGVLNKSLYRQLLINLAMETEPTAVTRKTDVVVQMYDERLYLWPADKQIVGIFDQTRWLLVLGDPGAGKTTTLLELTQELLERANQDMKQPIPVVFSLSSWVGGKKPFFDWAVNELREKYSVPQETAHFWVREEGVILILDALDEVRKEERESCLKALNEFRNEWPRTRFVVSSRLNEYEELRETLVANRAIKLMPLTRTQIEAFLDNVGVMGEVLRTALNNEPELWELARTPMLLNVMAIAAPRLVEKEPAEEGVEYDLKDRVWHAYVFQMFSRRISLSESPPYADLTTTKSLAWLARQMSMHQYSFFHVAALGRFTLRESLTHRLWIVIPKIIMVVLGVALVVSMLLFVGIVGFMPNDSSLELVLVSGQRVQTSLSWIMWPIVGLFIALMVAVFGVGLQREWNRSVLPYTGTKPPSLARRVVDGLKFIANVSKFTFRSSWSRDELINILRSREYLLFLAGMTVPIFLVYVMTVVAYPYFWDWYIVQGDTNVVLVSLLLMTMVFGIASIMLIWVFILSDQFHRLLLAFERSFPWRYAQFLEYCVHLKFMYRVGPSYVFIHRMLMDHFAKHATVRKRGRKSQDGY